MKNFIKFILVIFFTLFCVAADAQEIRVTSDFVSMPTVICVDDFQKETSICARNLPAFPVLTNKQNDNHKNLLGFNDKITSQTKFVQLILSEIYNKLFISIYFRSDKYLKDIICTRAP